ncbi:MAG: beta-eliminating lyase-related protein [Caldilineales bacterium]
MRQAGVIAAAGIVALNEMVERLADDHANARRFAEGIAGVPGITLDLASVQSNIVIFEVDHPTIGPQQLVDTLWQQGIWTFAIGGKRVRAVTNYHVTAEDASVAARAVVAAVGA